MSIHCDTNNIKNRIATYQENSSSSLYNVGDQLSKAASAITHWAPLMDAKVHTLRDTNLTLSKRQRARRTRIQDGGGISIFDAQKFLVEKSVVDENSWEEGENGGPSKSRRTGARQCGICHKVDHKTRICPDTEETDSENYTK